MSDPDRFFFVHLQKTGGTALFQRLRESFGVEVVYPTLADQGNVAAVIDVEHLVDQFRLHGNDFRVITGHFPLCAAEVLGVPFTTFTVLRDPVERTLSLLRRRQASDERFRGRDLLDIYADADLRVIIDNHMVKMLSLTAAEMGRIPLTQPVTFDDERLEAAKRSLERIDVVGLQEQFDTFCGNLESSFGWNLGPPRFANRTSSAPVPDELRERITTDNRADIALYRFAVGLVNERDPGPGAVDE
ncbi:MAG: hypothetical protein EXQ71_07355 [Acidimicrobiia bacterium]|nr:hypothetical protein [Acidimicrobiia bacterium]